MDLIVDYRWDEKTGIGSYLRSITSILPKETALIVSTPVDLPFQQIICSAPPFSIAEAIWYARDLPPTKYLWIPHINVPLFSSRYEHLIVTVHDLFYVEFAQTLSWMERIAFRAYFHQVQKADTIIAISSKTTKELIAQDTRLEEKITTIPHTRPKKNMGTPGEYYVCISSFKSHKNLDRLIEAFRLYRAAGGNKSLWIIGASIGERRSSFVPLEYPWIKYTYKISEIEKEAILRNAYALIMPSTYEGFGLPVLEAIMSGVVVIASSLPVFDEYAFEAYYPFDPFDINAIAKAILAMDTNELLYQKYKQKVWDLREKSIANKSASSHYELLCRLEIS